MVALGKMFSSQILEVEPCGRAAGRPGRRRHCRLECGWQLATERLDHHLAWVGVSRSGLPGPDVDAGLALGGHPFQCRAVVRPEPYHLAAPRQFATQTPADPD